MGTIIGEILVRPVISALKLSTSAIPAIPQQRMCGLATATRTPDAPNCNMLYIKEWLARRLCYFYGYGWVLLRFQISRSHRTKKWPLLTRIWCFPTNSSLNWAMAMKWCTKLEVALKRCPTVFQGHPSNFKVTRDKKSPILYLDWAFPDCNSSLNLLMALK